MNKTQFLKQLRYRLEGRLPEEELADVLSYYEAYFDDSEEDEEAVAERLGSPASVAEQILKDAGENARRFSTPSPATAGRRRPVLVWIIAAVAVIIVLSTVLTMTIRPVDSPTLPAPSESSESPSPTNDIIDLPRELYIVCPEFANKNIGRSSTELRFDFMVDKPMELNLDVRNLNGSLSLGIQNREDESWPYEKRAFTAQQETGSVTLQPGSYSVVVDADRFQGSWHILGQSAESSEPVELNQDVSVTLAPFDALELDVAVASVQIKTGSQWNIRLINRSQDTSEDPYQLNWRNTGGVLSVWSTPQRTNVLPSQSTADFQVEVTVPEGTTLDRAELALGVGSLDWNGCAVSGKLKAETGVGDLDVSASLGVADLSTGVGDLELKLAPPAEKADLTAGTGDVTLEITGNQSDYSWQLSTGTGDIRLNGEIMSPFLLTGGDGDGTLSLTSGTGDVSLEFQ